MRRYPTDEHWIKMAQWLDEAEAREGLEALYAALDMIDDRLRRCEDACRIAWTAQEDARKTVEYLTRFRIAVNKITEQTTAEGDA